MSEIEAGCQRRGWRLIHARSGRVGAYFAVQLTAHWDWPLSLAESIKRYISLRAWSKALISKRARACSTSIGWDSVPSDADSNAITFRINHAVACGAI